MCSLHPEDSDPLRRPIPKPILPKDLRPGPSPDLVAILQQLLSRVEKLEKDMRTVKAKLKLP